MDNFTVGVVGFPGSYCDRDVSWALEGCLDIRTKYLWHESSDLSDVDAIVLPGGFSYGDYLRCGAIARFSPLINALDEFVNSGKRVLGICNGFQILTETGLLKGVLLRNKNLKFINKDINIKVINNNTKFSNKYKKNQILKINIAHNEGNYFCSEDELKSLEDNNQIAVTYCGEDGTENETTNPNGAIKNIAGIFNNNKNVLGMMPHPERMIDKYLSGEDGSLFFKNILDNFK